MVVEVRFSQLLIRLKSPYLPKLRHGKIFTGVCQSFCPQGEGCLPQCMLGYIPQAGTPPSRQVHTPGQVHTPWQVHPQAGTPPCRYTLGRYTGPSRYTPQQVHTSLGQVHPPGRYIPLGRYSPHAHPHDSHCSGRYASYWNAFLFVILIETVMLRI